jgi:RNA polymerase sigma-70 factor (ECF subfamily)
LEAITLTSAAVADPDDDLVLRHRYGDAAAFEELYQRHSPMVYHLALRLAGDADEAADLTQDIFLRVYRHLDGFRGSSSLKTWIYRVALNLCRSRLGRRRPATRPLAEEGAEGVTPIVDPGRGPEELALAQDAARLVGQALAGLPLAFREAVVLRDLDGLAYEEIAEVLGVRIGTVRSRIARGREQLRQALEGTR